MERISVTALSHALVKFLEFTSFEPLSFLGLKLHQYDSYQLNVFKSIIQNNFTLAKNLVSSIKVFTLW